MKLKSFFANSVEEAIGLGRREMGPEAMLVNSQRTSSETRHLGAYEVVCAIENDATPAPALTASAKPAASVSVSMLVGEVSDLRQQIERLTRSLTRCGAGISGPALDAGLSEVLATLTEAELSADLAWEIVSGLASPLTDGILREHLGRCVRIAAELGCTGSSRKIAALVGPPGAGKTSALVKLAVQYGIRRRRRVQLLSLDTYRIAAAGELQSYAAILGTTCEVLENGGSLAQAIERSPADLVLIDTPGLSLSEMDQDLAHTIASIPEVDTHLVLAASMRAGDLGRAADQYSPFEPDKLLFTRLDETQTFGPILSQSARLGIPVSFLSSGQRIPEDIEAATCDRLLDLLLHSNTARTPRFGTVAA